MSRYRRRRRSSSSAAGPAIALAALALLGVMGVTVFRDRVPKRRPPPPAPTELISPAPAASVPAPAQPRTLSAMARLDKTVREVERRMPSLRHAKRGREFDTLRVELLAQASEVRAELGSHLDAHPDDDRAGRLWDRVLRAYVALKKL